MDDTREPARVGASAAEGASVTEERSLAAPHLRRKPTLPLWRSLAAISFSGALGLAALTASHELTAGGAITVFAMLVCGLILLTIAIRRPLLATLLVAAPLGALIVIDDLKFRYLREVLHPIDLYLLTNWLVTEPELLWSYRAVLLSGVAASIATVGFILLVAWNEPKMLLFPAARLARFAVVSAAVLAFAATTLGFFGGHYLRAVVQLSSYNQLSTNTGLRLSYLALSLSQMTQIRSELNALAGRATWRTRLRDLGAPGQSCEDCPDIVVFHVESVFDTRLLRAYEGLPPLWNHLQPGLSNANGILRTSTFGGRSMISELELLCGLPHKSFGLAGSYPNLFLRPFLRDCAPSLLRDRGYETVALYSTPARVNHAGAIFRAYGFDQFVDSEALKLPAQWHLMRDHYLVSRAIEILDAPRTRPRLIFVSGMFNHGPHGADKVVERFPGPYDMDLTPNPAERDYINRLNDTLAQLRRLEAHASASNRRVAVLFYGDHQPAISADYSDAAQATYGARLPYMTFFRMSATFSSAERRDVPAELPIEELFGHFLDWTGLARQPSP